MPTDDQRRIPSDRARAGQLAAQLHPAAWIASQLGVERATIDRWAESDEAFKAAYADEQERSARAGERQRVKILLDLDGIVDRMIDVTKDTEHRDWARASMYLVDKVMIPQSIQHNTTDINVQVAFQAALTTTIEKLATLHAARPPLEGDLPPLLTGEAAAESYGARSLKDNPALREDVQ